MNLTEIEKSISLLVFRNLPIDAKQHELRHYVEIAKKEYQINITKENVLWLVMGKNQYYQLLKKKRELVNAKKRTYKALFRQSGIKQTLANVHTETIDKNISIELNKTTRAITMLKKEHSPSFYRYLVVYQRINKLFQSKPILPFCDIYNTRAYTQDFNEIANKSGDRKTAKIQHLAYIEYMLKREMDQIRILAYNSLTCGVTRHLLREEYKKQLSHEQMTENKEAYRLDELEAEILAFWGE